MTDGVRIELDRTICSGHGRCYDVAPEVFEPDEEGFGMVRHGIDPDADAGLLKAARTGELSCPEKAIRVTDPRK